jgi:thymidine kinase
MSGGKLIFKYGCMGSGKSLQLIATAHNFQEHGIPFVIFKSDIDTRDGEQVVKSRDGKNRECVSVSVSDNLYDIVMALMASTNVGVKWILVDEAQFLTASQVDQLALVADGFGINVMCYGLRTDFQTHLFEGSKRLFEVADKIEEIKSSCYCGRKTVFNAKTASDGTLVTDGEQIDVGGDEKYTALCRDCYRQRAFNQ